jgi:hypothetical protein
MNILFTGSRDWPEDDTEPIELATERAFWNERGEPYHVYVGDCPRGVDKIVRDKLEWVNKHLHVGVTLHVFKADWDQYGKAAGPLRNRAMVEAAHPIDVVYAFHSSHTAFTDKRSGTWNCSKTALATGPGVRLYHIVRQP